MGARLTYLARFSYWLLRHRSWSSARWVMDYDGHVWPRLTALTPLASQPSKEILMIDRSAWPSEAELLSELRATFPHLETVRPLSDLQLPGYDHGAWICDRSACMSDAKRIFLAPTEAGDSEPPGYTCFVHDGFLAWLEQRGWHVETCDYGSYMVVPLATLTDMSQSPTAAPLQPGEVPF